MPARYAMGNSSSSALSGLLSVLTSLLGFLWRQAVATCLALRDEGVTGGAGVPTWCMTVLSPGAESKMAWACYDLALSRFSWITLLDRG